MQLTSTRETLLTPLQTVVGAVEKRATLPILSHVLLERADTRLTLTGTDLEIQLKAHATVEPGENAAITVQAAKLRDILKLLPEGAAVKLSLTTEKLTLTSGRSRFTLQTLPAENYPAFDRQALTLATTLPANRLKRALDKTSFAMANGDVRYYLNGMLFEFDSPIFRTVASDGHRLAYHEESLTDGEVQEARQVIIPRKGILELYRLIPDSELPITIATGSNAVTVTLGDVVFSAKLIEGRFPDFRRVMPKDTPHTLKANKDNLKAALSRTAILQTDKIKGVGFTAIGGKLILGAQNAEHEEATEELDVTQDGKEIAVGFNIGYLLDALSNVDTAEVSLSFPDQMNACLIEDEDDQKYKFIVMPMKI